MSNSLISHFPHELLTIICAHIYSAGLPSATPSLDPLYILPASAPTSQPTSYPPACWSEPVSRRTLANVALVNRAWSAAARPWLWRRLEVRLPRSWLALVDEIAGSVGVDGELDVEVAQREVDISIHEAAQAAVKARDRGCLDEEATRLMKEAILASLSGIPVELLSPPASREPSPRRLRSKSHSPARWQLIRTISDAMQDVMYRSEEPVYVPPIEDLRPGRYVQHIDFNHFRTIGMRRSVDEGVNSRFVTGDRLQAVLKETPNLVAFGATEYMDGALTLPVLKELFLRGDAARTPGHPTRGRGLVIEDLDDPEANDAARRRECRELEAVDLTGCVSGVMVNALADFVNTHLLRGPMSSHLSPDSGIATDGRNGRKRRARFEAEPLVFSSLKRLSLRGAKSIAPPVLSTFVLACPSLTHLDLSGTRVEPALLEYLGVSQSVQLESLALARCIRLTGESIRNLLIHAPATRSLRELNLYGDGTFPCPLSREEFQDVIEHAPCFTSGAMRYLDVSSAPFDGMLLGLMPAQPALRSLGLAYIPDLPLDAVARFLKDKAPQVEVLVLLGTSPELGPRAPVRQTSLMFHTKLITPLCLPPFSFSTTERRAPPTRLRVIELALPLLTALGAGAGAWRIIKSKGGRGWYVDTASGWTAETNVGEEGLRRDLEKGHPWREAMERLANANGNVASGVGWHARKMEVLYGHGLLGREDGLYGAVSFAYQG